MFRRCLHCLVIAAAGLALAGSVSAADETKKAPPVPRGFYRQFLSPRMDSRLNGEIGAATEYVNPAANPWTRDDQTVGRIEKNAVRAMKGALKQYALHSLQVDTWSVAVFKKHGTGVGPLKTGSDETRVRFGISHLTPRADVTIPSTYGRVIFSADLRGRVATSFDSHSSNFNLELSYDTPARSGSFSLTRRF